MEIESKTVFDSAKSYKIITLTPYLMLNLKMYIVLNRCVLILISWTGSQGSGMIITVASSTGQFVNVMAHHLPTPL